jgi:dihydropteroate synthase
MPILRHWTVGHSRALSLGPKAVIMGIVNATPDSFSGDGLAANIDAAIAQAVAMAKQGAAIIDVGGESTRPDAAPVSAALEQERILPVIEGVRAISDVLISVDTYRAETARRAVESGAHIVNDVWGLSRDPAIARLVAETGSGVVIMHTGREP